MARAGCDHQEHAASHVGVFALGAHDALPFGGAGFVVVGDLADGVAVEGDMASIEQVRLLCAYPGSHVIGSVGGRRAWRSSSRFMTLVKYRRPGFQVASPIHAVLRGLCSGLMRAKASYLLEPLPGAVQTVRRCSS